MKTYRILLTMVLSISLTVSGAYAGMPEIQFTYKDSNVSEVKGKDRLPTPGLLFSVAPMKPIKPMSLTPTGVAAQFAEFAKTLTELPATEEDVVVQPAPTITPIVEKIVTGDTKEDILNVPVAEEILTEGEIAEEDEGEKPLAGGFWTKRKLAVTGAILLLSGLIVGLVAIFASSSGGGSGVGGSGFGGGSGGLGTPTGGGPGGPGTGTGGTGSSGTGSGLATATAGATATGGLATATGTGGSGTATGTGTGVGPFGNPIGTPPINPEPSTFLLAGLGLLLPLLRKKK